LKNIKDYIYIRLLIQYKGTYNMKYKMKFFVYFVWYTPIYLSMETNLKFLKKIIITSPKIISFENVL